MEGGSVVRLAGQGKEGQAVSKGNAVAEQMDPEAGAFARRAAVWHTIWHLCWRQQQLCHP